MDNVKLDENKQKYLKVISKIIYVLAKIAKIFTRIGVVGLIIALICSVALISKLNVKSEKDIEFDSSTGKVSCIESEDGSVILTVVDSNKTEHSEEIKGDDAEAVKSLISTIAKNSKERIITTVVVYILLACVILVLTGLGLANLEKLFKNIYAQDTPFTEGNVHCLRMIAYFMIAVIVTSAMSQASLDLLIEGDYKVSNVGISLIQILFVYSISYIFEYGCALQKESQAKIYGDKEDDNKTSNL